MTEMNLLLCFTCLIFNQQVTAAKDLFVCNGTEYLGLYKDIYSLTLYINNISLAFINRHGVKKRSDYLRADVVGNFTTESLILKAATDTSCLENTVAICDVFGLKADQYNSSVFQPDISKSGSHSEFKPTHISQVKTDASKELFLSSFFIIDLGFAISPIIYSILVCRTLLDKSAILRSLQIKDVEVKRRLRTALSFAMLVAFTVCWAHVLSVKDLTNTGYIWFFVLEMLFLSGYCALRVISHCCEKAASARRQRTSSTSSSQNSEENKPRVCLRKCFQLFNNQVNLASWRVALSCFAVITPIVSWVMIRADMDIEIGVGEVFWWIGSAISMLCFMTVSQTKEFQAWKGKDE